MVRSFRDLEVWRKAHTLAAKIFDCTEQFPKSYLYDLTTQIRRAALSIPTNIAEGCATTHTRELPQFVNIARRSVSETQHLLFFAFERRLLTKETHLELKLAYDEVGRMLSGLTNSLKRQTRRPALSLTTSH